MTPQLQEKAQIVHHPILSLHAALADLINGDSAHMHYLTCSLHVKEFTVLVGGLVCPAHDRMISTGKHVFVADRKVRKKLMSPAESVFISLSPPERLREVGVGYDKFRRSEFIDDLLPPRVPHPEESTSDHMAFWFSHEGLQRRF
jgi:hypothetical protein